ncbi:MAG: alpha/beta hydrolase [Flavobacteriales bacterium]|nr:alpha/beta hydrolase [Flavobacteriales bacterium]|tara:strand:+ start:9642 stop:10409 length:768 start_codon:yes stop_codon:yes gene_type:complete
MKLHSKKYGDKGQDLIVIHGLFGMSDNWSTLGRKFSKHFKVHLIDLRNHGRSPHSTEFNYDVMCEDLIEYIEDYNLKKPLVIGHSLGGKVAMKLAFTHAEILEKLLIVDISPRRYNTNFHENLLKILYRLPLEDFERREDIEEILAETFENRGMRLFLMKNLFRNEHNKFGWRFNIDVLLEKVSNIQEAEFINSKCNVPTLFIRGGDSNYVTSEDEIIIKKHFTNFSISTIEGAGHWLHAEKPDLFYDEVIKFIC